MKKFISIISVAAISIAILGSCKKESNDTSTPTPTTPTTFFKCSIDGSNWNSMVNVALDLSSSMQITGSTLTGSSVTLIIQAPYEVGTYLANPNTMNTFTYVKGFSGGSPYSTQEGIGQGTLNITSVSATQIEGNFEFTGVNWDGDVKQITAGTFSTNIQ